jgi:hypothetical protein
MQAGRPSNRELIKRINEAKEYITNQQRSFANLAKAVGELNDLGINERELWVLIKELLEEISFKDYTGTKPPQKSYEKTIAGCELFAFSWWSLKLGKQMYIKFVIKNEQYYYVSLHQSRLKQRKEIGRAHV